MMYGDLVLLEELICDECLTELWPLEEDELRKRVCERLAQNASWLEEHYRWHGERELEDRILRKIEEIRRRRTDIVEVIQGRETGGMPL